MFDRFPPPDYIQTDSTIEGIAVYMPKPPEEEHQPVVEFNCPQCTAQTAYSATDGGLTCTNCGYYEPPTQAVVGKRAEEFEFTVETLTRSAHGWGEARKELQCQNCGVYTSLSIEMMTHTCPFCGSNKVIQHQAPQDVLRPRFLVPFKLEAAACQQTMLAWLNSHWMTPRALLQRIQSEGIDGVFIPYWTFDATLRAAWKAEVGHKRTRNTLQGKKTEIVWRWESGQVQQVVDDLLVCGSTHISQRLLRQVNTYNLQELAPYEPSYLAGLQAQSYDVPLEAAWETARSQMRQPIKQACRKKTSTNRVRNFSMELDFADESWRHILLPIYIATYRYRDRPYQVLINAQTGTIAGQRPADWRKVSLVIALVMLPALIVGGIGLSGQTFLGLLGPQWMLIAYFLFFLGTAISLKLLVDASKLDEA